MMQHQQGLRSSNALTTMHRVINCCNKFLMLSCIHLIPLSPLQINEVTKLPKRIINSETLHAVEAAIQPSCNFLLSQFVVLAINVNIGQTTSVVRNRNITCASEHSLRRIFIARQFQVFFMVMLLIFTCFMKNQLHSYVNYKNYVEFSGVLVKD